MVHFDHQYPSANWPSFIYLTNNFVAEVQRCKFLGITRYCSSSQIDPRVASPRKVFADLVTYGIGRNEEKLLSKVCPGVGKM